MRYFPLLIETIARLIHLPVTAALIMLPSCGFRATPDASIIPGSPLIPRRPVGIATPRGFQLQMGDVVDVFVIEDSTFNGSYPIRQSGDIIIPKLGRVAIAGKSLPDAEKIIATSLEGSQLKHATVIVDPGVHKDPAIAGLATGIVVRLVGNVAKKGRVVVAQIADLPVTAFQAVTDVGGFTPFADKRKSYIIRVSAAGTQRIPVNFEAIEQGKAKDVLIVDGDSIVVPQKIFGF